MESRGINARHALLVCAALALATIAVYWPTFGFGLTNYDDGKYVANCDEVKAGLSFKGAYWAFTTNRLSNWHPLTWLSYQLDATLFGEKYGWYHAENVMLHAAVSCMIFWLLMKTTGAFWRSATVAVFFALHPAHVESVAWISERKDVLSGVLGLGALLAYVSYAEKPSAKRMAWVGLLLALGLLAKPILVTWPAVMLLMDRWPLRRWGDADTSTLYSRATPWKLVLEKWPLFLIVIASSIGTYLAQHVGGATVDLARVSLSERLSNVIVAYVRYLGLTFWPVDLTAFYPRQTWAFWQVASSAALLLAITIAACFAWRKRAYLPIGWFWFLGTLVPVIGLVQVGGQSLADRYTYLPHIGLMTALVWCAADGIKYFQRESIRKFAIAVTAGLLIASAIAAHRQVYYWKDSVALWTHAIDVTNDNFPARRNLSYELMMQGRPMEARPHMLEAARLAPHLWDVQFGTGMLLLEMGQLEEGAPYLAKAYSLNPTHPDVRENFARALNLRGVYWAEQNNHARAIELFSSALKLNPKLTAAQQNLDRSRAALGAQSRPAE